MNDIERKYIKIYEDLRIKILEKQKEDEKLEFKELFVKLISEDDDFYTKIKDLASYLEQKQLISVESRNSKVKIKKCNYTVANLIDFIRTKKEEYLNLKNSKIIFSSIEEIQRLLQDQNLFKEMMGKSILKIRRISTLEGNRNKDKKLLLQSPQKEISIVSKIGNRTKQDDNAISIIDERNNRSLCVVFDGIGGQAKGDIVSTISLILIEKWFTYLKDDLTTEQIEESLSKHISIINERLYERFKGESGTTIALLINNKNDAIVYSLGDSRVYMYDENGIKHNIKVGTLEQLTEDDCTEGTKKIIELSKNLAPFYMGYHEKKANIYMEGSNVVTKYIGMPIETKSKNSIILKNVGKKIFVLTTDGITDLVTDRRIEEIIRSSEKSPETISQTISNEANGSKRRHIEVNTEEIKRITPVTVPTSLESAVVDDNSFNRKLPCPKDNSTIIVAAINNAIYSISNKKYR